MLDKIRLVSYRAVLAKHGRKEKTIMMIIMGWGPPKTITNPLYINESDQKAKPNKQEVKFRSLYEPHPQLKTPLYGVYVFLIRIYFKRCCIRSFFSSGFLCYVT